LSAYVIVVKFWSYKGAELSCSEWAGKVVKGLRNAETSEDDSRVTVFEVLR
jgi:hypothetical protein